MKFRSISAWQKPFAAFMLFALLSVSAFAQMATKAVPAKTGSLSKAETGTDRKDQH